MFLFLFILVSPQILDQQSHCRPSQMGKQYKLWIYSWPRRTVTIVILVFAVQLCTANKVRMQCFLFPSASVHCLLWALGKVDIFLVSVWLPTCDRFVLPLPGSRGPWETLLWKIPLTLVTQFSDLQNKCVPDEWFYAHLRLEYIQLLEDVSMNGKIGRLWFLL